MSIYPKIKGFCNKKVKKLFPEDYWKKLRKRKEMKENKDELLTIKIQE